MTIPDRPAPDKPVLRVATMNLWGWYFPLEGRGIGRARPDAPWPQAWAARRTALQTGLRRLRPDLVAFQELISTHDYDQAADLLGPGYHLAHQHHRDGDGSGISIASRWPLTGVQEVDLHLTPRTTGFGCVTADLVIAPQPPVIPL